MSGGSLDYFYSQVEDIANDFPDHTPERRAFRAHLYDVAAALKAIEWVDSGDCAPGHEDEPIRQCVSMARILETEIAQAEAIIERLQRLIAHNCNP